MHLLVHIFLPHYSHGSFHNDIGLAVDPGARGQAGVFGRAGVQGGHFSSHVTGRDHLSLKACEARITDGPNARGEVIHARKEGKRRFNTPDGYYLFLSIGQEWILYVPFSTEH